MSTENYSTPEVIHPKKIDGRSISVLHLPDGRVYVDIPNPKHQYYGKKRGPDYPHHYCRWEDYGIVDQENRNLVRCRMCGLVTIDDCGICDEEEEEHRD